MQDEFQGHAMALALGHCSLTMEAEVQIQASENGICGKKSGTGTCFVPSTCAFACQYLSTNAPYTFIH